MATAGFAAIASFEMVFFGKALISFGSIIKILALNQFIFAILVLHSDKFKNFKGMYVVVSKYLVPNGFRAITAFPFVLLKINSLRDNLVLIYHERIHIRQQLELLVLPFYTWYLIEYIFRFFQYKGDRMRAYRNMSFEREAYDNEHNPNYLKSRPFCRFLLYI